MAESWGRREQGWQNVPKLWTPDWSHGTHYTVLPTLSYFQIYQKENIFKTTEAIIFQACSKMSHLLYHSQIPSVFTKIQRGQKKLVVGTARWAEPHELGSNIRNVQGEVSLLVYIRPLGHGKPALSQVPDLLSESTPGICSPTASHPGTLGHTTELSLDPCFLIYTKQLMGCTHFAHWL